MKCGGGGHEGCHRVHGVVVQERAEKNFEDDSHSDQLVFHFKVVFFGGKGVIVMILVDIKTNRHANIAVMEFSKLDTINRRIL